MRHSKGHEAPRHSNVQETARHSSEQETARHPNEHETLRLSSGYEAPQPLSEQETTRHSTEQEINAQNFFVAKCKKKHKKRIPRLVTAAVKLNAVKKQPKISFWEQLITSNADKVTASSNDYAYLKTLIERQKQYAETLVICEVRRRLNLVQIHLAVNAFFGSLDRGSAHGLYHHDTSQAFEQLGKLMDLPAELIHLNYGKGTNYTFIALQPHYGLGLLIALGSGIKSLYGPFRVFNIMTTNMGVGMKVVTWATAT